MIVIDTSVFVDSLFEKNKDIEIELGCDSSKIKVIPNGIDITKFSNITKKADKDDFINIGTITRVVPIKDIKTMIQSFSYVKNTIKNAKFFIIGSTEDDEEYYKECNQLIDRLNLKDIVFTGRVDIKEYIGIMDILVLTSISEGQPFVILEGMASSKPFVSTDVGGCKELLYGNKDGFGKAGIIVPVMNIEKIAKAIIKLCLNKELRDSMGKNGLKRVSNLYTIEKCVKSYKEIYNSYRN